MMGNRCGLAAVALLVAFHAIGAASAQMLQGTPAAPTPESLRLRVSARCGGDVARFCPELSGTPSPQSQLICLRPYKSDLSLGCRGAVKAASR